MMCFSSFFAVLWQKMKNKLVMKFTHESSVSGPGEFGHGQDSKCLHHGDQGNGTKEKRCQNLPIVNSRNFL